MTRSGTLEHPPGVLEGVAQLGAAEGGGQRVVADGDVLLGVVSLDGALEQGQGVFRYSRSNLYSPSCMYRPILINIFQIALLKAGVTFMEYLITLDDKGCHFFGSWGFLSEIELGLRSR